MDTGSYVNLAAGIGPGTQAPAFAASFTPPDPKLGNLIRVGTVTANITINAPSGTPKHGDWLELQFAIDATGGYTWTWNAIYQFSWYAVATDIPTAANSKFEVLCRYHSVDAKWRVMSISAGFEGTASPIGTGEVELDFGAAAVSEKTFTGIVDARVLATSIMVMTQSGKAPTGRQADENEFVSIIFKPVPKAGTFDVYAQSITGFKDLQGKYKVGYSLG